jgi:hypothetical protein
MKTHTPTTRVALNSFIAALLLACAAPAAAQVIWSEEFNPNSEVGKGAV